MNLPSDQKKLLRALARLGRKVQVPLEQLLENALSIALNHVSMARDNALEIPLIDSCSRLCKSRSIARAGAVPNRSLLPDSTALRVL